MSQLQANNVHVPPSVLPWRVEEIDFNRIDIKRAVANEDLLLLLCAASFTESGSDLYTSNLVSFFNDDAEVTEWLTHHWEPEELQHGRALKAYIRHVWPSFDWEAAFKDFFAEFSRTCTVEALEKTRALEMVGRCVIETGTTLLYRAINEYADEPVIKEITDHIRSDEVRHYKYFFKYFKKYREIERTSRFAVLGALIRRAIEVRNSDIEITLSHAFKMRYPNDAEHHQRYRQVSARVNAMVRRHLSADMCIKMLLKPLDLSPRIRLGIHYPLMKLTQHIFFR